MLDVAFFTSKLSEDVLERYDIDVHHRTAHYQEQDNKTELVAVTFHNVLIDPEASDERGDLTIKNLNGYRVDLVLSRKDRVVEVNGVLADNLSVSLARFEWL